MDKIQKILIVDDEPEVNDLIYRTLLNKEGFENIKSISSINELIRELNLSLQPDEVPIGLILMDIVMPERDGIEGIQEVRQLDLFRDVPILVLTAIHDKQMLKQAFDAGAMDYITKPVDPVEFVARVGSAMRLKQELDRRKVWEKELLDMTRGLMESNSRLEQASFMDQITGLLNRKAFDKRLQEDWIHCYVQKVPISLMLITMKDFAAFNQEKGAVQGDECMQSIAQVLRKYAKDRVLLARYGGATFALLYTGYSEEQISELGQKITDEIKLLQIDHPSTESGFVQVITGIASVNPADEPGAQSLLQQADQALALARIDA